MLSIHSRPIVCCTAALALCVMVVVSTSSAGAAVLSPNKQSQTARAEAGPRAEDARPLAVVEEMVKDLGTVAKGDVIDHAFEILNRGNAPLMLSESRSSCGCAVLDWDQEVAPGANGFVRARIDTRTVSGVASTSVRVTTNDPDQAELELILEIKVEDLVGIDPPRARWDTVETETSGVIGVTLFALDGQPFRSVSAVHSRGAVRASVRPATESERVARYLGPQWRIELELADNPAIGPVGGYVTVELDHPRQKRAFIPTSGFVRPLIHIAPDVTDLGRIELGSELRRARYQVRNFGSVPMAIERVGVDVIDGAQARVEVREDGFIYDVLLEFDPSQVRAGPFTGKVLVHTDLERRPVIEIPAAGNVVKR